MYQNLYGKVFVRFPGTLALFLTCKIAAVTLSLTTLWEKVTGRKGSRSAFYTSQKKQSCPKSLDFSFEAHGRRVVHMFMLLLQRRLVKQGTAIFSFYWWSIRGNRWQGLDLLNWQEGRRWLMLSASKSLVGSVF